MENKFEKWWVMDSYMYIKDTATSTGKLCECGDGSDCSDNVCDCLDSRHSGFNETMLSDLDINILEVIAATKLELREEDKNKAAGDINYYQYFCDFYEDFYPFLSQEKQKEVNKYVKEHTQHAIGTYYTNKNGKIIHIADNDLFAKGYDNVEATNLKISLKKYNDDEDDAEDYITFESEEGEIFKIEKINIYN